MQLPPDNDLDLSAGDFCLSPAEEVALSDAEVLALLPAWARTGSSRLRDRVIAQTRRYWAWLQARYGFALAALRTPRHAAGEALQAHGARLRIPQAEGESEGEYRDRLLAPRARITPRAVREGLAGVSAADGTLRTPPVVIEPATDGIFIASVDSPWCAFVQPAAGPVLLGLYPDNPSPWVGVWLCELGPSFVVLAEGPVVVEDDVPWVLSNNSPDELLAATPSAFVGSVLAEPWAFVGRAAPPLEARIIADVEARKAHGVVWTLYVDPNLGGAL